VGLARDHRLVVGSSRFGLLRSLRLFSAFALIAVLAMQLAPTGEAAASIGATRTSTGPFALLSARSATSPAGACQTDGAIITTALAAFRAEHPHVIPTRKKLLNGVNGHPYLQGWSYPQPFYSYSISSKGKLLLAIPASTEKYAYDNPAQCEKLKGVTIQKIDRDDSCRADGATVAVAMAAFGAQNPHLTPSRKLLVGKKHGGPYLTGWPHYPPFYAYSLSAHGVLMVAIPARATPSAYRGPRVCNALI
jgi:hypothetical protein